MTTCWLIALALLPGACASGSHPNAVPNLFDTQQHIAAYIDSGRYAADCVAMTARARAYLDRRAWQAMAKSKVIPATLDLVRHARSLGVAVFFISGQLPNPVYFLP